MAQDPSAESKGDESNKESESKVDNSKYFDIKKEDLGLQGVIDIVLVDIDDKTGSEVLNPDIKWTVYNTGDPKIQVVYRKMGGDVYTIRGRTEIAISIDEVYDFFDCSKTDEQEFSMEIDKLQTSWKVAHVYDDDHCVVHTTFDTGFPKWIIWPRDFCYMKRRIKFDKCMCLRIVLFGVFCFVLFCFWTGPSGPLVLCFVCFFLLFFCCFHFRS